MKIAAVVAVPGAKFEAVPLRGTLEECGEFLREIGVDGVEPSLPDPTDEKAVRGVEVLHRDFGFEIPAISTGLAYLHEGLSLTSPDPGTRERAVERLTKFIELAQRYGAVVVVGLIRGRCEGRSRSEVLRLLTDSLRKCCRVAEELGVDLALEPINRYETDLVNTVDEALQVIQEVGSPRLGLLLDTFHMNIEEPVIEDSIRRAGPHIKHFHVADSNRYAPGMGHLDFTSIIRTLAETGYRRYLSLEILPRPTPEEAVRRGVEYLRNLLTRLGLR